MYEKYYSIYNDEVARLHPPLPASAMKDHDYKAQHPDDRAIFSTDELRFMLFRHWNLYDAMYHSSYVAGRLGIWREKGRKRFTGLLAKMGYVFVCPVTSFPLNSKVASPSRKRNNPTRTWRKTLNWHSRTSLTRSHRSTDY